jgi:hypothetical protein
MGLIIVNTILNSQLTKEKKFGVAAPAFKDNYDFIFIF